MKQIKYFSLIYILIFVLFGSKITLAQEAAADISNDKPEVTSTSENSTEEEKATAEDLTDQKTNKIITGRFETEFLNLYNYDSDDRQNEYNENFARGKLDVKVTLPHNFSINSQLRFKEIHPESEELQRAANPAGGGNRSFEDESLYLKILNVAYDYKHGQFVAGKFTSKFGQAFSRKDNIWLFEEARKSYEEDEKLGFAHYLKAGDAKKSGRYIIGISAFTNDSKNLDLSTITKKESPHKEEGIPGADRGLNSYDASMDINYDFGNKEKLSYHISYIKLAVNDRASDLQGQNVDEMEGYALNMDYQKPLHENIIGKGFIEYVNFNNYYGIDSRDIDFLTALLSFEFYKNYSITFGQIKSRETEIGTDGIDKYVREANLGYKFSDNSPLKNLNIIVGVKHEKVDYKTSKVSTDSVGTRIYYSIPF